MDQVRTVRLQAAIRLNAAAKAHQETAQEAAPKDTTALMQSIRIPYPAVTDALRTAVLCGNIEIRGTYKGSIFVDYHRLQNYGFHTINGGFVPGHFFWEKGEEAGRNVLKAKVPNGD